MPDQPPQIPVSFQMDLPSDQEAGVYADVVAVWSTKSTFVIDFAAFKQPPQIRNEGSGPPSAIQQARVVARVRIPPDQVFEIARVLTQHLDKWERGNKPPEDPRRGE